MIEKLNSRSRTTEVDAVSLRIIGAYKKTSLNSDTHLPTLFTNLETQWERLTAAINRSKAKSELESKDQVRDMNVRSFNYLILGFVHHPNAEIRAAALKVKKVFDKYGVAIADKNYAMESSLITSLLGDLAEADIQAAIALLSGCAETIMAIGTSQADFEASRIRYEQEKAEEGTQENATAIKKVVMELINGRLVNYLRAMEQVDEPTFGAFARTIATIIADNNIVVKKRSKKWQEKA